MIITCKQVYLFAYLCYLQYLINALFTSRQSKLFYRDNILYLLHWFNLENDSGRVESTVALFRVTVDPDTNQTRLFELNRFQFPDNAKSIQV